MFQSMRLRSKRDKELNKGEGRADLELESSVVAGEVTDNLRHENQIAVSLKAMLDFWYVQGRTKPRNAGFLAKM